MKVSKYVSRGLTTPQEVARSLRYGLGIREKEDMACIRPQSTNHDQTPLGLESQAKHLERVLFLSHSPKENRMLRVCFSYVL
jgi:hypothetical protein